MDLCIIVIFYKLFELSFWPHPFTRIHWWASDGMLHFSNRKKQTHLDLRWPEGGGVHFSFNSLKEWSICCRCSWKWIWIELFMLNMATYFVVFLCTQLSSFPAGCSSSSSSGDASDSDRPLHGNRRACPAKRGVTSYASCCHISSLECRLKEHDSTGLTEQVIYSQQVSINTMNTKTECMVSNISNSCHLNSESVLQLWINQNKILVYLSFRWRFHVKTRGHWQAVRVCRVVLSFVGHLLWETPV